MDSLPDPSPALPLDASWIYKVAVLADLVAKRVARIAAREGGLSLAQWRVLAALADRPGRTAREVVDVTPMDKGMVSRAVTALAERRLVARQADGADARRVFLTLTEEGQATFAAIAAELHRTGADGRAAAGGGEAGMVAQLDDLIARYGEGGRARNARPS